MINKANNNSIVLNSGGFVAGYAILMIPPRIPMILIPAINNNHILEKWTYKIQKLSQ